MDPPSGTDALSELTLDPSLNQVPVWSPDGKKIARQVNAWDWSRDGKCVLLRNENEVWHYSPSENKSRTYIQEKWPVRNAQFSPDSKYVAYITNESGRWEASSPRFPM